MISRTAAAAGVALAVLTTACAATGPATPSILPLRTLRLYETGVGYFERSGAAGSTDSTQLPVPSGHLDDALKTLVVLGVQGKTRIHGVEFGTSVSRGMARALAGLGTAGDEPLGLQQLLVGLKGASVEVTARGATRVGRLIDVVESTDAGTHAPAVASDAPNGRKDQPPPVLTLLVLSEAGEIVRFQAPEVESVRPLDPTYATRLRAALDAFSSHNARSERVLHVLSQGGPITLGYVAETPVWRTTYRLVLDAKGAMLQAWALLHNDTEEDWRGVRVELANGRPDSFLFPLAAPRYTRRALATPSDPLATVPQLLDTTADALWGDQIGDAVGAGGMGVVGMGSGYGHSVGSPRMSQGYGSIDMHGGNGSSTLLEVGNLAGIAPAAGVEAGALFVYALPDALDLHARASVLVPFAQQRVDAMPMAWFESPGAAARSGVRFVNSTEQTLPPGTLAFFGDGGFAGESALPRLKPGERRFITFGQDLDVELVQRDAVSVEEPKRLVWRRKSLEEHYLKTTDFTYAVENRSGQPRKVVLAMALDKNATLTGPDQVDFDEAGGKPIAMFACAARAKEEKKAHAVEGLRRWTPIGQIPAERMAALAAAPSLDARDRAAAQEAAARLREAETAEAAMGKTREELAEAQADGTRLREHMKALAGDHPGAAPGANPFAARVLAVEDRLTALRKKLEALESEKKRVMTAAEAVLVKLVP